MTEKLSQLAGYPALPGFVLLGIFALVETVALVLSRRSGKQKEHQSMFAIGACSIIWVVSVVEFLFFRMLPGETAGPGLFVFTAGILIRTVAFFQLGKFYNPYVTLHDDHRIVDTGLYRFARHPLYAGSLCLFLGFPLIFSSAAGLFLFFAMAIPVFLYRIRVEERMLASHFGDAWSAYARKTPALFIRFGKR